MERHERDTLLRSFFLIYRREQCRLCQKALQLGLATLRIHGHDFRPVGRAGHQLPDVFPPVIAIRTLGLQDGLIIDRFDDMVEQCRRRKLPQPSGIEQCSKLPERLPSIRPQLRHPIRNPGGPEQWFPPACKNNAYVLAGTVASCSRSNTNNPAPLVLSTAPETSRIFALRAKISALRRCSIATSKEVQLGVSTQGVT